MIYLLLSLLLLSNHGVAEPPQIGRYDHKLHENKVFNKHKIKCSDCHNLKETKDGELVPTDELKQQTFKKTLKSLCHECHQGGLYKEAPKTCYTCHSSQDQMLKIKPQSHQGVSWRTQHAAQARADSSDCLDCHVKGQCVKCHTNRNPVKNMNHSRNYRYYHSIEARMRPHACDSCHVGTFCTRCHLGGTYQ